MSRMIECDGCKCLMRDDSSANDAYHEIWIDRSNSFHLCVHCFEGMMAKILHMHYDDDEEQYVAD